MSKITFDGGNKLIYVNEDVETLNVESELYSEWKRWIVEDDNAKFLQAFRTFGGDETVPGQLAPKYFFLTNGWRIVVDGLNLVVASNLYTDEGNSPFILQNDASVSLSNSDVPVVDQKAIQYSSYGGRVTVDKTTNNTGTVYPVGNTEFPVNNMSDAVKICQDRGFKKIYIYGDYDLVDEDISGKTLIGQGSINSKLTLADAVNAVKTQFIDFELEGILDGNSIIDGCKINDLSYFNGEIRNCKLDGIITCQGSDTISFIDCKMNNITRVPTINCGGDGQDISITGYEGGVMIANLTGETNQVGVGLKAGYVNILPSCTGGRISLSGAGALMDNSGPLCEIIDWMIDGKKVTDTKMYVESLRPNHTGAGKIIYWDTINGNDDFTGSTQYNAVKTFAKAQELVRDNQHDVIAIVPGDSSGVTVINEPIVITKNFLLLRGPGIDVHFHYTSDDDIDVGIEVQAVGVELSGFKITNDKDNSLAIKTSGDFTLIENVFVEGGKNGIYSIDNKYLKINNTQVLQQDGYALKIEGDSKAGKVTECVFSGGTGDAVIINTNDGYGGYGFGHCAMVNNGGAGMTLSETTQSIIIDGSNVIENNGGGNVVDNGTYNVDKSKESESALSSEEHDAVMNTNTITQKIFKFVKLIFFIK